MGLIESGSQLTKDFNCIINRQVLGFDTVRQGTAAHIPHHKIRLTTIIPYIIYGNDRGMLERRNDLGFAFEAHFELRVGMQKLRWQYFDSHLTLKEWIPASINSGHAATPKF